MKSDVSSALATLQADPANAQALATLAGIRAGNGSGIEPAALALALSDARRLHRERADWVLCTQLIDVELAMTAEGGRRADLLHEKARILADELLQDDAAMACLTGALETAPGHPAAAQALSQLRVVKSNWERIAAKYLADADTADDPQLKSTLTCSAAELHRKHGPPGRQAEELFARSLALDPRNRRAALQLERLLRGEERDAELLPILEKRIETASSREERAAQEAAAGDVASRLHQGPAALDHYRKALAADPAHARALSAVAEALTADEQWLELVKIYEGALRASKRPEGETGILVQLGMIRWRKLSQITEAELHFRRLRKADARHPAMLDFYREYHMGRGEVSQLLAVLAQAQKVETDPARRAQIGVEMAQAAESSPQHLEKAIDIWKGLFRATPRLPEAVVALRRLYTRAEKWNALLELLKDELESLPAAAVDEKIARYLEIVSIYRDRLNLDVMVVNTYTSILALRPDHPTALAALGERYEAQGRWSDLIQVLGRQAEGTRDPRQRVGLYRRVAVLWVEKFGKHQNAVAALEKILEVEPADSDAREQLKQLYVRSRSWRALLALFRNELAYLKDDARRTRLGEMARLAADRLGDLRESIGLWNEVLALPDGEQDPEALMALAGLYDREKRWPALVEVLDRQCRAATGTPAEVPLLERRGALLHEKLGATTAAVETYRRLQVVQPDNARATRALREIYAQGGDFASLEALYTDQQAFEELCETLSAVADRTADLALRTRLLERVAVVAQEQLAQPERALKAYERILATDPQNRKAAAALVPLYRAAEKWPRLLATYEILLTLSSGGAGTDAAGGGPGTMTAQEKLVILVECRRVCEERLGSKALAFQWCARAYELAPADAEVGAALERLAGEADEWPVLSGLYARRLEALPPGPERLALLRRSLRIALGRFAGPSDARQIAEEILSLDPTDEQALDALEGIFSQSQAWTDLSAVLHRRESHAPDAARRIENLFRIALIEEEKIGDLAAAERTFGRIVAVDPKSVRALRSLGRVQEALGHLHGLAATLGREADLYGGDERAEVLQRLGEIHETQRHDLDAAFDAYREVLSLDPVRSAAVAGLERLAESAFPRQTNVAALLAPFYERTENLPRLASALEVLAAAASDKAAEGEAQPARLPILVRLRGLYAARLRDTAAAYGAALRIFALAPADVRNREELAELASEAGTLPDAVLHLRRAADTAANPELRRDLLLEIAEIQEQRLAKPADAETVYTEILAFDPVQAVAYRALERLYRDGERWEPLRSLIEARIERVADADERMGLLGRIAEIDESLLEDGDHAVATYRRMLDLDPSDDTAYRALDRIFVARQRGRDLEDLLTKRMAFAAPADAPEIEVRRAEIRLDQAGPGDLDGAVDLLESAVGAAPRHEGARALLERALALPGQRARVARLLEPLFEASGNWSRLADVLEAQGETLRGAEAAALSARVARIQEDKLQARAVALSTWRRVLTFDPGSDEALAQVERLGAALERWGDLVQCYEELARRKDAVDVAARADLLGRAARLHAERLGNRDAAIDVWRRILDLDPSNLVTAQPAAAALEALYVEAGDIRSLVTILRTQADWSEETAARAALLFRIAALEEGSLDDVTGAIATLRSILDADPASAGALDNLERIFDALGNHAERADIIRRRIELGGDPTTRRALRGRLAELLERDLDDTDEAIAAYVAVLDEMPDDVPALEALARLYEKKERHGDRLEVLERRLALATDARDRAGVLRRIGDLLAGPLGRAPEALERWQEILKLVPEDAGTIAALEKLMAPGGSLRLAAARVLEPVYESSGSWARLCEVVRILIEAGEDGRERVALLCRLAGLQEVRLRDDEGAFRSYGQAVKDAVAEPELPGLLDALERLAAGRAGEVIALYREITPDVLDEGVQVRLDRWIADSAGARGDSVLAATHYRRILDRAPADGASLLALEQIHRDAGDDAALYDILARRAELAAAGPDERALRAQMGALAAGRLARTDDAIAAYERVFELRPGDADAVAALDRLYTDAGRWPDLTGLLARLLDSGMSERQAVTIRFRLAELEADRLHDNEKALEHLAAVLRGSADHSGAIALLERMLDDVAVQGAAADLLEPVYAGRQAWSALIKIDEIRLAQAEDAGKRVAWTRRIARLYEEQLEDLESAFRWYGKVFREIPGDRWTRDQILRLAGNLGLWKDTAAVFTGYLEGEYGEEPHTLDLVRITAEILDGRLDDRTASRQYYRRLLNARPDDRAAAALLEGALERWGQWRELRDLLDEQASRAAEPATRKELLARSARIDEEKLDDRERAVSTLRAILETDAADGAAVAELERLLRAEKRWHDLQEHLAHMLAGAATAAEADAVALRLAEVHEQHLDDPAGAIDRYQEVLDRTPGQREAVAALERLIVEPDPERRFRVARILEPVYRESGEWQKLVVILETELETVDDPTGRVERLREVAEIHGRYGRSDMAFDARRRAWLADITSADTLAELESLAVTTRQYGPLVTALQEGADKAGDPDLRAHLHASAAKILESKLNDPARAIEAWQATIAARLDDVEAYVSLERLLAAASRMVELGEVIESHAEMTTDSVQRKALHKRVAVLNEQTLRRREKAIAAWRAVLELDDRDEEALDSLGRLYVASLAWRDLAGVYQRKIELTRDPGSLRLLRLLAARLYDEKLSEPGPAVSELRALLDDSPGDRDALELLDRIFTRDARHAELLEVLDVRAATEQSAPERETFAFRAARLTTDELADPRAGIERYRAILGQDPGHAGAAEELWKIARGELHGAEAISVLEPLVRAARPWDALVELLELRLGVEAAPGPRFDILCELGRIHEKERRNPAAAFDAWARAFAEDPSEPQPRAALERLTAVTEDYRRLADVYDARLGDTFDSAQVRDLALRLAELHETRLGDLERAADYLRKALDLPGDELEPLTALARVLRAREAYPELTDVLAREADATADEMARAEILYALGDIRLRHLGDSEGALQAFRDVLGQNPNHAVARAALHDLMTEPGLREAVLDILEPLAEARGDFEELAARFEQRAMLQDERSERARWLRQAASVYETKLGSPGRAVEALGRALREDPTPGESSEELERVAQAGGVAGIGARRIEAALEGAEPAARRELTLAAARLYGAAPDGAQDAERLYEKVLVEEPDNVAALDALEAHHRSRRDDARLAGVLERRGAADMDPGERRARYSEAADLRERLGDMARAIADWQALRQADDGDVDARAQLARLLALGGQEAELATVLEESARFTDDAASRAALYARIGELRAGTLGDLDGAADAYREALDAAPENPALLTALEEVHERRGDWSALQDVLTRRLAGAMGAEQVAILLKLAANAEVRLSDLEQAAGFLHQVLAFDPGNQQAYLDLERMLSAHERWYDLIDVLTKHADIEAAHGRQDSELRLRVAIADVWEQRLESPDSAAEALEKVLAVQPDNVRALLSAARLHEAAGRPADAASALERAAATVGTGPESAEIFFRLGHLQAGEDSTEAVTRAETWYLRALERDPMHRPSLEALEFIARASANTGRIAQVLELREMAAADDAERKTLLLEMIALWSGPLRQPEAALACLQRLAALAPDDTAVRERLAQGMLAAGRLDEAEAVLRAMVDASAKTGGKRGKEVARYQQKLGALAEARGDLTAAADRYGAAYQIDPSNPATLAALGALAMRQNDMEKARRFYRSLLLQTFDAQTAGISKADVYLALGRIHLTAGEGPKARNMFERGLESDPRHEALKQHLASLK